MPMEAVAGEAEQDLVPLLLGDLQVARPVALPDGEQADDQALISDRVQIVQLGLDLAQCFVGVMRIESIRTGPGPADLIDSFQPVAQVRALCVLPRSPDLILSVAKTVDPLVAERVVKQGGSIAAGPGRGHRRSPVNSIRGVPHGHIDPAAFVAALGDDQHLVGSLGVLLQLIPPDQIAVAAAIENDVGARHNVERGFVPGDPVRAGGVADASRVAAHVPHLEDILGGVVPDAIAEDHGTGLVGRRDLPSSASLRPKDRAGRVERGLVVRPLQSRLVDEKIIDEELPADVDGDDLGGPLEIGNRHGLAGELLDLGRPLVGQHDAVVQGLACIGRQRAEQRGRKHHRQDRTWSGAHRGPPFAMNS